MKLLHICCNLAGSTVFPQLFEQLSREGHEQTIFVPERRKADIGKNEPKNVPVIWALTVRETDMLFFFRKAQRSVPVIREKVDLSGVQLIHAHTLFTDGSVARKLWQETGIPYMVTLRYSDLGAIWTYEPHLHPMARQILRDARRVVFLSEAARAQVLGGWLNEKDRAVIEPKTEVIPNGIDEKWLTGAPRTQLHMPIRVGFAGRMNDRKRPLDALAAVHAAGEREPGRYAMMACGVGPLAERFRAQMNGADEYVGSVSGMEAMKQFYAECDMLLVPSLAETFGMVYLEAMSQGVPVLYTRGQGFDGQFAEGEAGFAVGCGDIAEQAKRIRDITDGYAERSARCVALAAQYAWKNVGAKWTALYNEI